MTMYFDSLCNNTFVCICSTWTRSPMKYTKSQRTRIESTCTPNWRTHLILICFSAFSWQLQMHFDIAIGYGSSKQLSSRRSKYSNIYTLTPAPFSYILLLLMEPPPPKKEVTKNFLGDNPLILSRNLVHNYNSTSIHCSPDRWRLHDGSCF
jgi:hypothetical protein